MCGQIKKLRHGATIQQERQHRMGKYDDIINLPHHVSTTHKPMPLESRAAQFGSFAALRGHREALEQTEHDHECAYDHTDESDDNRWPDDAESDMM